MLTQDARAGQDRRGPTDATARQGDNANAQSQVDARYSTADPQLEAEREHLLKRASGNVDRAWTLYERQLRTMAQRGEPVDPARADAMRRALLGDQEQGDMFGPAKQERPRREALTPVEKPVQQQLDGLDDGMLFSTFSPKEPPTRGQKGWGNGNMSLRAEQAIAEGKRTAAMIAKEYRLKPQTVRDMLRTREYHHILPEKRKTPVAEYFYDFDPKNDEIDASRLAEMRAREKGQKTEALQKRTRTLAAKRLGLKHHISTGGITDANGNHVGHFVPWGFDASTSKNPIAAQQMAEIVGLNKGLDGNYYTEENSHPVKSIVAHGEKVMERVINEHIDSPQAMTHPLIGDISFYWGNPGTEAKGFHDGYGVSHIIAARNAQGQDGVEAARHMIRVIAEGQVGEPYRKGTRIDLTLGEATAVLSLDKHGNQETWLLTGWKEAAPDETGESNNRQSYAHQSSDSRTDAGAGATPTLPQSPPDVKDWNRFSTASDSDYMAAVERGDTDTAQKMVDARMAKQGYDRASEYRGYHAAPGRGQTPLTHMERTWSDDIYGPKAAQYYGDASTHDAEAIKVIQRVKRQVDKGQDPTVTVYRAVPKGVRESRPRVGDWVSLTRGYAADHGETWLRGDYRVQSAKVKASHLYTEGSSIHEFGFDDGTDSVYRDTPHNQKLTDPVTYDDQGNVIPLSRRFDETNPDIRYSTASREFSAGDYPDSLARIVNHTSLNYLKTRPDYRIAKGKEEPRNPNITPQQRGEAAEQVVNAVVKPAKIDELRALLDPGKSIVIVPVIGPEATSVNMLPLLYADRLAEELGGTVWEGIGKLEGAANTGVTTEQRHHNVQRFDGQMPPADAQIIVVDDTPTSGDTLASLIDFLAANDRMPVAASVLANGRFGLDLKPTAKGIQKLLEKAGMTAVEFEHEFGYSPEHLTGLEAREYLLKGAGGKEGLRSSFPARRSEGRIRGRTRRDGPTQGPGSPGQVTEPSSPKFSTSAIGGRNFPKVDHDPDSVGKTFAITRSATSWTPSKPWVIREDLGDYRQVDLQEPLTAAEKRGTFRSHAEASRWVEAHEGSVRFSTAADYENAVPAPQRRRFQQAAFAALIQHGGDDQAYKQAMQDQFGHAADQHLDAFREEYARRKSAVVRQLQQAVRQQQAGEHAKGRPDLANIGETPETRRMLDNVDESRNIEGKPETRHDADVEAEADRRLQENYEQERADIEAAGLAGRPIDDVQVVMARRIFNDLGKKAAASGNVQDIMAASDFANAYRETGSELGPGFESLRRLHSILLCVRLAVLPCIVVLTMLDA